MSPDMFTLEQIFNMDLARYKDICLEIVGNSVKELSIERNINDIEKVIKYMKNIFSFSSVEFLIEFLSFIFYPRPYLLLYL